MHNIKDHFYQTKDASEIILCFNFVFDVSTYEMIITIRWLSIFLNNVKYLNRKLNIFVGTEFRLFHFIYYDEESAFSDGPTKSIYLFICCAGWLPAMFNREIYFFINKVNFKFISICVFIHSSSALVVNRNRPMIIFTSNSKWFRLLSHTNSTQITKLNKNLFFCIRTKLRTSTQCVLLACWMYSL